MSHVEQMSNDEIESLSETLKYFHFDPEFEDEGGEE